MSMYLDDGVSAGGPLGTNRPPMDSWQVVIWFLLITFLGLLTLPHEAVMWGLVLLAVAMVVTQAPLIAGFRS